jgi:ribosomal protein S27AE
LGRKLLEFSLLDTDYSLLVAAYGEVSGMSESEIDVNNEKVVATSDDICPNCKKGILILEGKRTLACPTGRKAWCPLCIYEEEF